MLGQSILGEAILGDDFDDGGGGGGAFPHLVAILNGPAGYIYEVDANGLTQVEIRFNGFINLPTFNPAGGPGDVLRYYKDPIDATGSLLNEAVDPAWSMDLHRGNGFIDLGTFHINDPPIGEGDIEGTLNVSQAGNTLVGTARLLAVGTFTAVQDDQTSLSGGVVDPQPTGTLVAQQADNFISASGKVLARGTLNLVQDANVSSTQASSPIVAGLLIADEVSVDAYLDAEAEVEGFLLAEASIGPVLEGAPQ